MGSKLKKQNFSSFNELLIKKDLSEPGVEPEIQYDKLTQIFLHVDKIFFAKSIEPFAEEDQKKILSVFELSFLKEEDVKLSKGECESMIREKLKDFSAVNTSKLIQILGKSATDAQRENSRIKHLAKKYAPRDPEEQKLELKSKIEGVKREVIDIEMDLMSLEKDGLAKSERFLKASNARERRVGFIGKLSKELKGLKTSK